MKSNKDHINKFFVQRLGDESPADEGWNMPSDDIWNKAKVHFPKEKKKRRPFLFWFGAGVIAVGLMGLLYFTTINGSNLAATKTKSIQNNNTIVNTSPQENLSVLKNETSTNSVDEYNVLSPKKNKTKPSNTESKRTKTPVNKNEFIATKRTEYKTPITQNESITNLSNSSTSPITPTEETSIKTPATNSSLDVNSVPTPIKTLEQRILLDELPILAVQNAIDPIIELDDSDELGLEKTDPIRTKRQIQKWEVGLTHAGFMLPFNHVTLKDTAENQKVTFDAKNINFNIPITRRLNRRWSITSGYSYTNLDLDMKLEQTIEFNQNATEDNIETLVDDIINKGVIEGNIELNDEKRSAEVKFIDNVELMDGDILTLNALIPLRLKLHQIPLLVNYHLGKRNRKFEWTVHAGVALEYFDVKIPFVNLDVQKNNSIITEPPEFEAISTKEFTYGIFAGAGTKYHFTDHFNIGLNTKIDLTGLPFARYELGLFYGFTPKNKNKTLMQF